jgi:hypothetical protein
VEGQTPVPKRGGSPTGAPDGGAEGTGFQGRCAGRMARGGMGPNVFRRTRAREDEPTQSGRAAGIATHVWRSLDQ